MPAIMTVGDIVVEFLSKSIGQNFNEPGFFEGPFPAGSSGIFANQVAKTNSPIGIFAKVGVDGFADAALRHMSQNGVDLRGVSYSKITNTGSVFVRYLHNGSRDYIFHYANSAMGELTPNDIDESLLDDCKFLFISGASAFSTDSICKSVFHCVELAKKKDAKIVFDPNVRKELVTPDSKAKWDRLLADTHILLASEEEVLAMSGEDTLEATMLLPQYSHLEIVVLKMGKEGSRLLYEGKDLHFPAYKVEEVDPTGAGDNWDGAFISSLLKGISIEEAMDFANKAGAMSVTRRGPSSSFSETEIRRMFP